MLSDRKWSNTQLKERGGPHGQSCSLTFAAKHCRTSKVAGKLTPTLFAQGLYIAAELYNKSSRSGSHRQSLQSGVMVPDAVVCSQKRSAQVAGQSSTAKALRDRAGLWPQLCTRTLPRAPNCPVVAAVEAVADSRQTQVVQGCSAYATDDEHFLRASICTPLPPRGVI